jgi:hypothetical protein
MKNLSSPHRGHLSALTRPEIFKLPSVPLDDYYSPASKELADSHFNCIRVQPSFGDRHEDDKAEYWRALCHYLTVAAYLDGTVRYSRRNGATSQKMFRVIECAEQAGFLYEEPSVPGRSPHQTRLLPIGPIWGSAIQNPAEFLPNLDTQYVKLFTRGDDREAIPFGANDPYALSVQRTLEAINEVLSRAVITGFLLDTRRLECGNERRLNPILRAYFTEDFTKHGRLYAPGPLDYQNFPKAARARIRINGTETVELDYAGLHTRILYHREGIDYQRDPYKLWGDITTPAQRILAKKLVNTGLNAKTKVEAIQSCRNAAQMFDEQGELRRGKDLETAQQLINAIRDTKADLDKVWDEIWALMIEQHPDIAHYFGKDMGIQVLMPLDGAIMLDVLTDLTRQGIPALGVHDSVICEAQHERTLRRAMIEHYQKRLGFPPKIDYAHGKPYNHSHQAA